MRKRQRPERMAGLMLTGLLAAGLSVTAAAGDGRVAATANGQTLCRLDWQRRVIVGCDGDNPEASRDLVGPAGPADPEFVAVGCLSGDTVATVCRQGDEWSVRTFRTRPDGPVAAAEPLQDIAIGTASGPAPAVDLAVSPSRGWLAVTGLPPPLPPVLRAAVAGGRLGPLSDRGCPVPAGGARPVAAAVSPDDELVLALRRERGPDQSGEDELAFYDSAGRELLRLGAGIRGTVGLDFNRGDGTLWAAAAEASDRTGVWRLDAAVESGRQRVHPHLISPLADPLDLACLSSRRIAVVHGAERRTVTWIDLPATSPGAAP